MAISSLVYSKLCIYNPNFITDVPYQLNANDALNMGYNIFASAIAPVQYYIFHGGGGGGGGHLT